MKEIEGVTAESIIALADAIKRAQEATPREFIMPINPIAARWIDTHCPHVVGDDGIVDVDALMDYCRTSGNSLADYMIEEVGLAPDDNA